MSTEVSHTDARLDTINRLVDLVLGTESLYRVETRVKGGTRLPIVDIFIDGDNGVTVDQCAATNRSLLASIELEGVFKGGFKLNVSSPGLDRPLQLPRQYRRHVGKKLEVLVRKAGTDELRPVSGKLVDTAAAGITITSGDEQIELRFDEIEKAVVTPAW